MKKLIYTLLLGLLAGCSASSNYGLRLENDIVGDSDNNYTHGTYFQHNVDADKASKALRKVAETLPALTIFDTDPTELTRIKTEIGQEIHTPDDLREKELILYDVPYAGYLYGKVARVNATPKFKTESALSIGVVGPAAQADEVQWFVHHDLDMGADPVGWPNQLPNESTINFDYTRSRQWHTAKYLNAVSEIRFRLGTVHTDFRYSNGFRTGYNVPSFDGSHVGKPSVYLFGMFNTDLVGRNMFYDGTLFRDSHSVSTKHFVGSADTGIAAEYNGYSLKFKMTGTSKQYSEQEEDFEVYGGFTFGLDW
jgi:hypothetical protein